MTITISAGNLALGQTISEGDPPVVLSGGIAELPTILSGGSATLSTGGGAIDLTVSKGGVVEGSGDLAGDNAVFGTVSDVTLISGTGIGGDLTLFSGGDRQRRVGFRWLDR